jgi:hypothetical protein
MPHDPTTVDKVNEAHLDRLRTLDRLYDTGQIDYDELQRRERAEERQYDAELERVIPRHRCPFKAGRLACVGVSGHGGPHQVESR